MSRNTSLITRFALFLIPIFLVGCGVVSLSQAKPLNSPQLEKPAEITAESPTAPPEVTPPIALPDTGQKQTIQIEILDDFFQPQVVTIPIGYSVIWVNQGTHPHTVTADDGSFSSHILQPGSSFEHQFTNAGNFDYFCEVHGESGRRGMYGTITVATGSTPVARIKPAE